ncbi:hypothetical protein L484_011712 [Morus notabilis]|uniref:Uncharacterized protein n=1 Tax=Morus notabilis TaxID=981085 RepID=W9RUB9_9ROSA|nr:hypothetical protein L484_011712 [Morus notabilis]
MFRQSVSVSARTTCSVSSDQALSLFEPGARPSLPVQTVHPGLHVRRAQPDKVLDLFRLFFLVLPIRRVRTSLFGLGDRLVFPYRPSRTKCSAYSTCSDQVLGMFELFRLFSLFGLFGLLGPSARPVRPIQPARTRCSACSSCSFLSACSSCSFLSACLDQNSFCMDANVVVMNRMTKYSDNHDDELAVMLTW